MTNLDETVVEFLVESNENLDRLDQCLLALENEQADSEVINEIFRIVHTIKGTCGFFDFKNLEALSHVGENLLDSLRSNEIAVTPEIITALLSLNDALRKMFVNIEHMGNEGEDQYPELKRELTELNSKKPARSSAPVKNKPAPVQSPVVMHEEIVLEDDLEKMFAAAAQEYERVQDSSKPVPEVSETAPLISETVLAAPTPIDIAPETIAVAEKSSATKSDDNKKSELADSALRVDVSLLDKLMNLVGELVLARNQILQFTKKQTDSDFISTSQRLNLITSELQEGVMRTRMQPIANIWNKLPRIVRDVAAACGKQVNLEMYGKETELDKTIIEAIKDPLTHIIRNAVDHGIETPGQRSSNGKSPDGALVMRAFHEGGQVIIEISDNGAGLNVERIKNKAVERGIISQEKALKMTEHEIQRLIFLPGFSTAEKVTNISGRGVGMDVVRSNIERIGGTIDVSSKFGQGSSFTIKIPLTLAIIPGLMVTAGDNRYAIPQVNLLELVRIEGAQIKNNLEEIHGSVFYRLRGKLLPIIRLRSELKLDGDNVKDIRDETVLSIVVVKADNIQLGLIVDAIFDTEEIVVKPLGKLLKSVPAFAGATIMGDGRVALILDVAGLAANAHITKQGMPVEESVEVEETGDRKKFLIFQLSDKRRAAIPLDQVHRLEEFETSRIETAAGQMVIQYRGGILPLIDLQETLGDSEIKYNGIIKAFVHSSGGRHFGFVVKNILDIVEQSIKVESSLRQPGLVGSAVIQGAVTELIDLSEIIRRNNLSVDKHEETVCMN